MAEYALHYLRMGGVTWVMADVVQREGRWKSDAYNGYIGSHEVDVRQCRTC